MPGKLIEHDGAYLFAVRNTAPATIWLVAHGDSITAGYAGNPYIMQLADLVRAANPAEVVGDANVSVGGISWNYDWHGNPLVGTMISDAPSKIDPFLARGGDQWLIAFAGTNGLRGGMGNHSAEAEFADFETYITGRISSGRDPDRIIVPTMLPCGPDTEAKRVAYNALLVSGASTYGYRLARLDLDPDIGGAEDYSNTTYYLDGLHPTEDCGHPIIAQIIYDAIYP